MRVLNICNLKGGVGKTITAVNMASVLADGGCSVLVIDNDQQGNASQFFGVYGYEAPGLAEFFTKKVSDIRACIRPTMKPNIDIISSNLNLASADRELGNMVGIPREMILKNALKSLEHDYDFIIIDNAPSISITVINALVAGDDVIIPTKSDRFTFEGVANFINTMNDIKGYYNQGLNFLGCLITFYRNTEINVQGADYISQNFPILDTKIRYSDKVSESTFGAGASLDVYSKRSGPAKDYRALVKEYLDKVGISNGF